MRNLSSDGSVHGLGSLVHGPRSNHQAKIGVHTADAKRPGVYTAALPSKFTFGLTQPEQIARSWIIDPTDLGAL